MVNAMFALNVLEIVKIVMLFLTLMYRIVVLHMSILGGGNVYTLLVDVRMPLSICFA